MKHVKEIFLHQVSLLFIILLLYYHNIHFNVRVLATKNKLLSKASKCVEFLIIEKKKKKSAYLLGSHYCVG